MRANPASRHLFLAGLVGLLGPVPPAAAQTPPEPVDRKAVEILREEGLKNSQAGELLSWICDVHGPRLTGSPNLRRAQRWAKETLSKWGLANARLEPWGPFGRGWRLRHVNMEVVGENPWPVLAWPKAWSPGLEGRVEAEVVLLADKTAEQIDAMDLSDKIVLVESTREVSEPFEPPARRLESEDLLGLANGTRSGRPRAVRRGQPGDFRRGFQRRLAILRKVFAKRPVAILDRGYKGDYGTLFVTSAAVATPPGTPRARRPRPWTVGAQVIPQFTLAVEHYNRICRLLHKGLTVRLAVELDVEFVDGDGMEYNVLADLPGTDPELRDELVMLGAHFDSWHAGTGATDNGAGSAVMMEAMRLLTVLTRKLGKGPRRTIRVALWSGEEQGLLGSRAYVARHFAVSSGRGRPPEKVLPAHGKLSAYYNLDNGTGRIRGVYLQGNEAAAPIFRAWLRPFHDLDAATLTLANTGGTDHLAFDAVGLPGFQFIQDPIAYGTRTHHSNMDVWDHAIREDLAQAATIVASFVWHTAQRDAKLPRKPVTRAAEASGPRRRGTPR